MTQRTEAGAERTPEEKMLDVQRQVQRMHAGEAFSLFCPYCGTQNRRGENLCCVTLGKAVAAALERLDLVASQVAFERIQEGNARQERAAERSPFLVQ